MGLTGELSSAALELAMPDRALRCYPALLSTEADALAWARAGAPSGAVVAAIHQAAPRGRGGRVWRLGDGFAFSMVLRPQLPAEREGWLYVTAGLGAAEALGGEEPSITWPDEVRTGHGTAGAVSVQVGLAAGRVEWAVISVLVASAPSSPARTVADVVTALEAAGRRPAAQVRKDYRRRCETLGHQVRARLVPLGPGGPEVTGTAVDVLADGALVIATTAGRRIAVPPQNLGLLEDPPADRAALRPAGWRPASGPEAAG